jgi:hypothetical protein
MKVLNNKKADEKVGLNVWVYIAAFIVFAFFVGYIIVTKVLKGGLPGA